MSIKSLDLAHRYAIAIYSLAREKQGQETVFRELRDLRDAFDKDSRIYDFFASPVVREEQKSGVLKQALEGHGVSDLVRQFLMLLCAKKRLSLFPEIVEAYQKQTDADHGVSRGVVHSAAVLGPDSRKQIETIVSQVTQKHVILTYKNDPNLIGGLRAKVGSYAFDDSLSSHLSRIQEDLTRRSL